MSITKTNFTFEITRVFNNYFSSLPLSKEDGRRSSRLVRMLAWSRQNVGRSVQELSLRLLWKTQNQTCLHRKTFYSGNFQIPGKHPANVEFASFLEAFFSFKNILHRLNLATCEVHMKISVFLKFL